MSPGSHSRPASFLLKTRHLTLLLHLYEHRSVLRAAEAANMTQPAASKLLLEMEKLLGVPLFERHARGIEPTWYGHALARRARAALSELGHAQDEIAALRDGRLGQASVGTVVNPGSNLVPQAVALLKRDVPGIKVHVEMDYSRPLVAKLLNGELDVVIGRIMDPELGTQLQFEALADEPHSVIARAGHPLAARARLTHADLAGYGWIMPPEGSVLNTRLNTAFLEHRLPWPSNIVTTNALPVTITLLRESDLLTALPVESLEAWMKAVELVALPIQLGVRMEDFGFITRRNQALSPAAERMLAALRTTARRLYAGYADRG